MSDLTAAGVPSATALHGPCVARAEDLADLVRLTNHVFRPAPHRGDMGREFPTLLGETNLGHQYIFRDAGRVVSHVGVLHQTVHTLGVELPVACIGAVGTDPEYRKAGLAGQLMDLAIRQSIDAGDILMPISGKRTLYTNRGATSLGPQVRFAVPTGIEGPRTRAYDVCAYEPDDWPQLAGLQIGEPVRYVWGQREPRMLEAIRSQGGTCLLALRKDGQATASLLFCVDHPMYGGKDGRGRVVQFLGEAQAIPALLAEAAKRYGLAGMDWPVLTTAQPTVARTLVTIGATGTSSITNWTVVILSLARLIEKIAPVLVRAGIATSAADGRLTIEAEGKAMTLVQADLQVELLFRHAATWSAPLAAMPSELRTACAAVLPVPLPDYGINYV